MLKVRLGYVIVLRRISDQGYITAPHLVAFYDTLGIRRTYSRLKPPASPRGDMLKNLGKCLWCWEPNRRSNFFSPPAYLCAVTYITEILLHLTLSNQYTNTHSEKLSHFSSLLQHTLGYTWIEARWIWLFNVTFNDISVIYVTTLRCATKCHRHFVGFFNVPVQAPTRSHGISRKHPI